MKRIPVLLLSLLIVATFTSLGFPIPITVDEIIMEQDASFVGELDAQYEFLEWAGNSLNIRLINKSTITVPGDEPSGWTLTGFGFNLPEGYSISGGRISGVTNSSSGNQDWSTYWGYDNNVDGGPFFDEVETSGSVNSVVATLAAAVGSPLDNNTDNGWQGNINGPSNGIFPANVSANNWDFFLQSAVITIDLDGPDGIINFDLVWDSIVNSRTVASFGSPEAQATPVPESATMLLLGVGLIGLAGLGRKQFKK